MIIGVGIDAVKISRMEKWNTSEAFLERFFHPVELKTVVSRQAGHLYSLAARFAAKEAFGKALGIGLSGLKLRDICVENRSGGQPILKVYNTAREALEQSGGNTLHLSLTHDGDMSMAVVIIEKR